MFLQTVTETSKLLKKVMLLNLLKTATDCCSTERQIQRNAWSSAYTARVAQQCLHARTGSEETVAT